MYDVRPIFVAAFSLLAVMATGHGGAPPQLPTVEETAPATVLYTDASADIVATTWCAYGVSTSLKGKKNGSYVTLTFNSVTTDSPHSNHVDTTWNVSLTPLNLAAGDTLVWEVTSSATAGPFAGRKVVVSKVTQVQ